MRVYATLPAIHVTDKVTDGWLGKEMEIYVISLASDLHGASEHRARTPVVGSSNETLTNIISTTQPALKFFLVSASNIFENIRADQPPSLSGDGIVLYPPADPEGMLALHFAIVESDKGNRKFGEILEGILGDNVVTDMLSEISKLTASGGALPVSLLTSLFGVVTKVVPKIIQENGDDILFSHNHSGVAFTEYGGNRDGESYPIGNDLAGATLKIWTRE